MVIMLFLYWSHTKKKYIMIALRKLTVDYENISRIMRTINNSAIIKVKKSIKTWTMSILCKVNRGYERLSTNILRENIKEKILREQRLSINL